MHPLGQLQRAYQQHIQPLGQQLGLNKANRKATKGTESERKMTEKPPVASAQNQQNVSSTPQQQQRKCFISRAFVFLAKALEFLPENPPGMSNSELTPVDHTHLNSTKKAEQSKQQTLEKIKEISNKQQQVIKKSENYAKQCVQNLLNKEGYVDLHEKYGEETNDGSYYYNINGLTTYLEGENSVEELKQSKNLLQDVNKNRLVMKKMGTAEGKQKLQNLKSKVLKKLKNSSSLKELQKETASLLVESGTVEKKGDWNTVRQNFMEKFFSFIDDSFKETKDIIIDSKIKPKLEDRDKAINAASDYIIKFNNFSSRLQALKNPEVPAEKNAAPSSTAELPANSLPSNEEKEDINTDEAAKKEKRNQEKLNSIELGRAVKNFFIEHQNNDPTFLSHFLKDPAKAEEFEKMCRLFILVSDMDCAEFKMTGEVNRDGIQVNGAVLGMSTSADQVLAEPATISSGCEALFNQVEKDSVQEAIRKEAIKK